MEETASILRHLCTYLLLAWLIILARGGGLLDGLLVLDGHVYHRKRFAVVRCA